jgi:hypothetical protein
VSSVALSASVRETRTVGTPSTSEASRAPTSVRTNCDVGTSTLPPRWPHFFSDASWSSKWTPAAPASIIDFISSNACSGPAEARLGIRDDRREPVDAAVAFRPRDLVGPEQRVVQPAHERGALFDG